MRRITGLLFAFFWAVLLFSLTARAIDLQRIGTPFVDNYTKGIYQAGNQNWSVTKDAHGVMYFGNSDGLLSFDGKCWQLNRMPNRITVRAVAADGKDKIYAGGFEEFGYWQYNGQGKLTYRSLVGLVPEKVRLKDEIWKIYADQDKVIFQSFATIYIYQNGKIKVVKASNPFLFLFKTGSRYFTEVIKQGLFELKGDSLVAVPGSKAIGNANVLSILPFDNNTYLIGTDKNGLFLYDGFGIKPWKNQANDFLKTQQLNNGVEISGGYYAFGTILNGIIIVDKSGNIIQHISKTGGLQNNTVLSLFVDQGQNLWAGLDNGIDRIETNSPLYFYLDKTGSFGTVYSSIIYQDKIYLGTNQGLFYSNLVADNNHLLQTFSFKLIPGSQGQVWDLSVIDGQLFCGHNNGTYKVADNRITNISAISGGWIISKKDPKTLIQGTYTGLVIYRKNSNGSWVFSNKVNGFDEPSRYVETDGKDNIWVSQAYKGLYKLVLTPDLRKAGYVKLYNQKNGLPNNYHVGIFNLEGQIVFATNSGFYIYDNISDRFFNYQQLNKRLGSFFSSNKVIKAADKKYWFINHGKMAMVDFERPGLIAIDSNSFSMLNGKMVQTYENISRINPFNYLISIDDGFVIYNTESSLSAKNKTFPAVLIRKVEDIADKVYTIADQVNNYTQTELPYTKNSLRISYTLPYYQQANIKFQYRLQGYSDDWSSWSASAQKEFTNLPSGKYNFEVRAEINGMKLPNSSTYRFTINPPWYNCLTAYFIYMLLLALLFWQLRRVYIFKLKKHKQIIQDKLNQEKEEFLKQEAIGNQQKFVQMQNERLQTELQGKGRELTNSAMNIVYKNELLQKIRYELSVLKDNTGKKIPEEHLKKIQKVIDDGITDERDWNLFENSFNETHESFFKKLKVGHPDLVPNDLKLCAYLRMNMNSKEIASLLNITLRGVEIRRYRLRKKLNLEHDQNLVEFLMGL